jgi:hypothetical protein
VLEHGRHRAAPALLRTVEPLDEPRGYCLDISGSGPTLDLEAPLQAHTCKGSSRSTTSCSKRAVNKSARVSTTAASPSKRSSRANRAAARLLGFAHATLAFCRGRLSPASRPELCVGLAAARGEALGHAAARLAGVSPQSVALDKCDSQADARQTFRWLASAEATPSRADDARAGMPRELALALAAFGHESTAPSHRNRGAVRVAAARLHARGTHGHKDLAYGPHERQHVDIYTRARRPAEPVPAIVVFHGGGLIGGNRGATANVAEYFASLGYVGVNGGYRLAPEAKWPEGARDVAAAVTYLRDHVAEYGGDPNRIFVAGISTGASARGDVRVPVPSSCRPTRRAPRRDPRLRSLYVRLRCGRPRRARLFREDRARWPDMVVNGNVTRTDIPVLDDDGRMGQRALHEGLRGAVRGARRSSTA